MTILTRLAATAVLAAAGTALVAGCNATTNAAAGATAGPSTTSSPSAVPVVQLPTPSSTTAVPVSQPTQAPSTAPPSLSPIPTDTPTPCPFPEMRFVRILSVGVDPATHHQDLVAQTATGLCGGGIPNDAEYTASGPAADYDVAATVTITARNHGGQPFSQTWSQFAAGNLNEYGGFYGIDFNNGGLVTVIDQYFHP